MEKESGENYRKGEKNQKKGRKNKEKSDRITIALFNILPSLSNMILQRPIYNKTTGWKRN